MALLEKANGELLTEIDDIADILLPAGVSLESWPVLRTSELKTLLSSPGLTDAEKEAVLSGCDVYFNRLRESLGYQSRDLVVLFPETPGLDDLLAKFHQIHFHEDDEVRYILDGEGVFGFVLPGGEQVALLVEPGDFIRVPKNVEHWFHLTAKRRIKAVRYFTSTAGWVPVYTETRLMLTHPFS